MTPLAKALLVIAALMLFDATILGAYASHGLEDRLDTRSLASLLTAIQYQFYHSLGLLATALLADRYPQAKLIWAATATLFIAGILLFCGSIYLRVFGFASVAGAAPFGGVCFMLAWLALALGALRAKTS